MRISKKVVAAFSVALTLSFASAASAEKHYGPGVTDTEIKIGQTMPYSGALSVYGQIGRAQLAYFAKINAEGGINGRKITLISLDDGYMPPKALEQVRRLIEQDEVLLIFNSVGTATNIVVRNYLNGKKVPHLFVAGGDAVWGDYKHYPWTMGWGGNYQAEGRLSAEHILANRPNAKIAILALNDDYGRDYVKGFKDGLGERASTMVVGEQTYEYSDPTVDSQIVTLHASGADTFFGAVAGKHASQAYHKMYPDQAKRATLGQLELARRLGHAFNLCWSLTGGTYALVFRGETQLARQWVAEAEAMARAHAMTHLADVTVPWLDGLVLIRQGNHAEGYAKVTGAMKVWRSGGGLVGVPWAYAELAAALMGLRRLSEARTLLDEAIEIIDRTDHRMYEAEVHRVLGELHLQGLTPDIDAAQTSFLKALEVARAQDAKGWELRAATSLGRLWQSQGKRGEAYDLLAPVYNWFTEGFDTRDLQNAKALLQGLSAP